MAIVINGTGTISGISATDGLSSPQTGSVLQVVGTAINNGTATSSTTYVATNMTASITPKFSTSKILIIFNSWVSWANSSSQPVFTIYRGATNLATNFSGSATYGFGGVYSPAGSYEGMISANFLDSPATTSATTYTIYGRADGGGTANFGNSARVSNITLMEIAA